MQIAQDPAAPERVLSNGVQVSTSRQRLPSVLVFALVLVCLFLTHFSLLKLPYIWDEAGYYIPAARDLLLNGSLIPQSTISNAHPPLVTAWLAGWWKLFGYAPPVTRGAMLVVAAFALTGVFRLARRVAGQEVAIATVIATGLYSVFFTQSSMAHLDMAAAAFTIWGLGSYFESRPGTTVLWFSLAALAKETAIIAPAALLAWQLVIAWLDKDGDQGWRLPAGRGIRSVYLLIPVVPLAAWFGYHYLRTGHLFGNEEYFRYNVTSTLHPLRILLALGTRVWHLFGYLNIWLLTAATILAMFLPPRLDSGKERARISVAVQLTLYVVIAAYLLAMAVLGGALLARYLLPVYPLWILVCVSTLWRRVRYWTAVAALIVAGFVLALFVNPPYGFAFEDNLAYRDYIRLHVDAETFLEARYPMARVLTAWPASDEITRPYLGYLGRPMRVVRIDNFSFEQLSAAADFRDSYEVALVFSTKYLPTRSLLARWPWWESEQKRYFGFHRDLPPEFAARILGGEVTYTASRNGQWVGVIRIERVSDAALHPPGSSSRRQFQH